MPSQSKRRPAPSFDCDAETARRFRNRGLANLLRMGHCAPSIMQAMLDVFEIDAQWLVKLMAGMPGGIGNTGGECGGVTAPLVVLGLRHGQEPMVRGLPVVVYKGHHHLRRFAECQGTTACRGILGNARLPLRCVGVIMQAPILCAESCSADCTSAISAPQQEAFRRLYDYWCENEFHCAHAVFHHLQDAIPVSEGLLNGSSGFMGGTALHRDDLQCARRRRHGARPEARPDRDQSSARPAHGRVDGRTWRCVCRRCQRVQQSHESRQSSGAVVHGRVRQHPVRAQSRSVISPRLREYSATSMTAVRRGAARWLRASRTGC